MRAERLSWDSAFFGFAVERICVPLAWDGRVEDILGAIRRSTARVIYVFVPVAHVRHDAVAEVLSDVSGVRQGERVLFWKDVAQTAPAEPAVRPARQLTAPIMELAFESGRLSRFRQDAGLAPFFQPMYRAWIERDFAEGKVLVFPDDASPEGMVSVSVCGGVGRIGLLAVRPDCRGRGVAAKLLRGIDNWLATSCVTSCEVATQGQNAAACSLYRRSGFEERVREEVWHVWR